MTFGRSLNSQVVSPVAFHSVASRGISFKSGSRATSVSNRLKLTAMSGATVLMWGSSLEMSAAVAMIRSVFEAGALAVAAPVAGALATGAVPAGFAAADPVVVGWAAAWGGVGCAPAGLLSVALVSGGLLSA